MHATRVFFWKLHYKLYIAIQQECLHVAGGIIHCTAFIQQEFFFFFAEGMKTKFVLWKPVFYPEGMLEWCSTVQREFGGFGTFLMTTSKAFLDNRVTEHCPSPSSKSLGKPQSSLSPSEHIKLICILPFLYG